MFNSIKLPTIFTCLFLFAITAFAQNNIVKGTMQCGKTTYKYEGKVGRISKGVNIRVENYYLLKQDTVYFYSIAFDGDNEKPSSYLLSKMAVINFCQGTRSPGSIEIMKDPNSKEGYILHLSNGYGDRIKAAQQIYNGCSTYSSESITFLNFIRGSFLKEEDAAAFLEEVQVVMDKYKKMFKK